MAARGQSGFDGVADALANDVVVYARIAVLHFVLRHWRPCQLGAWRYRALALQHVDVAGRTGASGEGDGARHGRTLC
jgi:hypothetical protein